MPENFGSPVPIQPLSIGNVVSAGVRLYRSHLKTYLKLSLIAHLWVLFPIYGWAKYANIPGLISRLAFGELTNQPESVEDARSHVNRRLWSFITVNLRVGIYVILAYLGLAIVSIVVILLGLGLGFILGFILGREPIVIIMFLAVPLAVVIPMLGLTWFYSRWVIADVALAVEENINSSKSINRSWELTQSSAFRVQGVVIVANIVTLPIVFLFNSVPSLFLQRLEQGSTLYWIVYSICLLTSLVGGIFVMPFWQVIKAVIYYDLRSRREGLGLQLRNHDI
ncbi:hypothetical protein [Cylindrospermum sp. FACHB-282]|uniref:hypothetical protein n=1 Tax=Cylindrospermum sp. FACHB-282 TaxID=2692794 RepID=UPI00168827BA|nr:hypothetical protein [Cylindrospermum sp. FACHB-282]MBD2384469.1 hypothetical protein [Cylindrospermum sp. FACHB-282]